MSQTLQTPLKKLLNQVPVPGMRLPLRLLSLFIAGAMFSGCAVLATPVQGPSIQSRYPVGHPRLIAEVPECLELNRANLSACFVGARMMQTSTAYLSTVLFLNHWEQTVFGPALNPGQDEAVRRILVPVLKRIYRFSHNDYTRKMQPRLDELQISSRHSFDSFKNQHLKISRGI